MLISPDVLIKVFGDASTRAFQATSMIDSPLTLFQFYFPCHLFRLKSIPLPLSLLDGWASHPICPPANMREPLSFGGGQKCSIQFPSLILALREMVLSLCLSHAQTQTYTHKSVPTVLSFCSPRLKSCIFTSYKFFWLFCSPWPSLIHDQGTCENTHQE